MQDMLNKTYDHIIIICIRLECFHNPNMLNFLRFKSSLNSTIQKFYKINNLTNIYL